MLSENLSDEKAVELAQKGDRRAESLLLERYRGFVGMKTQTYFLVGAESEDVIQEGMIGLYKAIRDFKEEKHVSFKAFADVCVTRQIITAIKTATRQKHMPLNNYVSLSNPLRENGEQERAFVDFIPAEESTDPVRVVIGKEELKNFKDNFPEMLSAFEAEVLKGYMQGKSYQDIAIDLDCEVKAVDNALQRIKRKMEEHFQSEEHLSRRKLN
ncbi:MAG: RNA polymerase sporulation sigma factor SigH [Actinomycetota bacterium]|nr:RNA polymerase sporulation sigma factor SigH [Actinomycetota bacterium]